VASSLPVMLPSCSRTSRLEDGVAARPDEARCNDQHYAKDELALQQLNYADYGNDDGDDPQDERHGHSFGTVKQAKHEYETGSRRVTY
jgi:hypothetical protein